MRSGMSMGRLSLQRERRLSIESLETRAMLSGATLAAIEVTAAQLDPAPAPYVESAGTGAGAGEAVVNPVEDPADTLGLSAVDVAAVVPKPSEPLCDGEQVDTTSSPTTSQPIPTASVASSVTDQVLTQIDFGAAVQAPIDDMVDAVIQTEQPSMINSTNIDSLSALNLSVAVSVQENAVSANPVASNASLSELVPLRTYSTNEAPIISDFCCTYESGNWWTLTGLVTDDDDSVEGDTITFGGVLASYSLTTTADVDGAFSICVELSGLTSGYATAQASDPHGALSDVATYWVVV